MGADIPAGEAALRLLADDLTGALDSAAPFATAEAPVTVLLGRAPDGLPARCALSTESRNLPEPAALEAVGRAVAVLRVGTGGGTLWFKKIDSVLRGHPYAETARMLRATGLAGCLCAPAFPAEGRLTRGGLHGLTGPDGWRPLPQGDLHAGLAAAGLAAAVVPDAETQAQLEEAVAPLAGRRDLLWAGARGLAQALAGSCPPATCPPLGAVLIGTTHPATRAQVAALAGGGHAVRVFDLAAASADAAQTLAAVRILAANTALLRTGGALLIVGGDTLAAALGAAGALAVEVTGEVAPGLPVGRIRGGRLDGRALVTKSGGFGAPDLLLRLARGQSLADTP